MGKYRGGGGGDGVVPKIVEIEGSAPIRCDDWSRRRILNRGAAVRICILEGFVIEAAEMSVEKERIQEENPSTSEMGRPLSRHESKKNVQLSFLNMYVAHRTPRSSARRAILHLQFHTRSIAVALGRVVSC